ncbi:MAG: hypothetical protein F4X99_17030 [Gammaproteobacteria bacterium]|nr:hypothetical protein [Gammaproteobacteria bacterium]
MPAGHATRLTPTTPPPGGGRAPPPQLQDLLGNEADAFSGETVKTDNRAPTYVHGRGGITGTDASGGTANATAGTRVSGRVNPGEFSDPDGDTLTFSLSADRPDSHSHLSFSQNSNRVFFEYKDDCELANLDPQILADHTTTVTLTATDPYGATATWTRGFFVSPASAGGDTVCPRLTAAAVDGKTLTLTYEGSTGGAAPSGLSASEFTVTVDGEAVKPTAVSVGSSTTSGTKRTTPVTLTLPESVGGGQTATVSHRPGDSPTSAFFTDHAVTVTTANNVPTAAVADAAHLAQNAPPGVLKTAGVVFADPDVAAGDLDIVAPGETPANAANALTVAVTADRPDVVVEANTLYNAAQTRAYFQIKETAGLCRVEPRLPATFETKITVMATDNEGASVTREIVATTAWDEADCGPALSSATVDGAALTLTFDKALDETSEPAPGDFAVTVAGAERSVSDVEVSGTAVVLTLAEAVAEGEEVRVGYTAGTTPIRPASGTRGAAESFTDHLAANHTGETPTLEAAVAFGATLTLLFDEALDEDSEPAPGDFAVSVAGAERSVSDAEVSGASISLTLASAVSAGERVTVSYERGANPIRHATLGFEASSFAGEAVVNASGDNRAPRLRSLTVQGTALTLTYDEFLDPAHAPTRIRVYEQLDQVDVTGIRIFGRTVALTLASAVADGSVVELNYLTAAEDAAKRIQDFAGNAALSISLERVTHGPPPPATATPLPGGGAADTAPGFGNAQVPALSLREGEAMAPVVLPEASGGDGDLTYSLTSAPAGLAGLSFDPASRRLSGTPTAGGRYFFTYTVHDADANRADSDAAVLRFDVRVETALDRAVKRVLRRTLAAVAARALTGALANTGARFADAGTGLRLAGRAVLAGGVPAALEQACRAAAYGRQGFGRAASGDAPACGAAREVTRDDLMRASGFEWASADGGGDAPAPLWAVWGRGDFGSFEGRPEDGARYEGETRTGWLGVDARRGAWVAGVALARGTSETDYGVDLGAGASGSGRLETTLTAVYPYGRWRFANGLEVRLVLGAGSGEARHFPRDGERATGDLTMRMASVGLRRELAPLGSLDLALRAEASAVRLEVDEGPDTISGVSADARRFRLGLEASRRVDLGGESAITPFLEAAARHDGGDGVTGGGFEIAGGLRYEAQRFHVEARGRWLAAHSEDDAREQGVSVTARFGAGAGGRGLWVELAPRGGRCLINI